MLVELLTPVSSGLDKKIPSGFYSLHHMPSGFAFLLNVILELLKLVFPFLFEGSADEKA